MKLEEILSSCVDKLNKEVRTQEHRVSSKQRPDKKVELTSIYSEGFQSEKTQLDPTSDLVELQIHRYGVDYSIPSALPNSYIVYCKDTEQVWYAPTEKCLNQNFIYREDLLIKKLIDEVDINDVLSDIYNNMSIYHDTRKSCYILDNPPDMSYEVYYDSNYPKLTYGKATPDGMFVHKYKNRFHRDMAILMLDNTYSTSSEKAAKSFQKRQFKSSEAVVISDGCWMNNSCASSYVYLDSDSVLHMTEGYLPTDEDQAVLISELKAATNALKMCTYRGKKKITYYYDNTSIINVFKNRKTEYIKEVVEWKELLETLNRSGYKVDFIELHPKQSEERIDENKALMFFHNMCDTNCRNMSKLFKRSYADYAKSDDKSSKEVKTYSDFKGMSGKKKRR